LKKEYKIIRGNKGGCTLKVRLVLPEISQKELRAVFENDGCENPRIPKGLYDLELPEQISFEMHYSSIMGGLDWREREITSGELALFSRNLYDAGYRVISREDNRNCGHCSEFTVVRVRCPPGPRTMEERVQH